MQFTSHSGVRKYASNTLWLLIENILRIISGLLVGIWVTRYLGPEKYGVISYIIAFVTIFGTLAKVGLDSIIVRNILNFPEKRAQYLGTSFWLKMAGSLLTIATVSVAVYMSSIPNFVRYYVILISSGLIFQSFEVIDFYYQSQVKSKYVSICKIIQLSITSLLKLYLIYIHADLALFIWVYLVEQIILGLMLHITYTLQKHASFYSKFDMDIAKSLLIESWPVVLVGIAITLQSKIDQLIIGSKLGVQNLGYFALAVGFIEILSFVPIAMNSSISPAIINAKKRSVTEYKNRLQNYYSVMFFLSLLVGLPIFIFGKYITVFLYGADFAPAGTLFSFLALRVFFANMGVARYQFIVNEKLFKFNLVNTFFGALVSVLVNIYLIPIYGAVGAIIASYCSFFVSTFLIDSIYKKTRSNVVSMLKGMFKFYTIFWIGNLYKSSKID
ncbi:flippase [Candidatus Woesebacteria bacterium]|nr:flippase [Candidatus Woesebacteria bacterium]